MADTNQQDPNQQQQQQKDDSNKSLRWHRRQERIKRVREGRIAKPVRVYPRDEIIARDIKHGGRRFPEGGGSAEWPLDQFTKRRLRDGTVRLENEQEAKARQQQRSEDRQRGQNNGRKENPPPTPTS